MSPRIKISLGIALLLLVLVLLFTFFLAPNLILSKTEAASQSLLGTNFTAADVKISPFGKATFIDAELSHESSGIIIEFEKLTVRPSLKHFSEGKYVFKSIHVVNTTMVIPPHLFADKSTDPAEQDDNNNISPAPSNSDMKASESSPIKRGFNELKRLSAYLTKNKGKVKVDNLKIKGTKDESAFVVDQAVFVNKPGKRASTHGSILNSDGLGRMTWNFNFKLKQNRAEGKLDLHDFSLSNFGELTDSFPITKPDSARINANLEILSIQPGEPAEVAGQLELSDLWIKSGRIANDAIGPMDLEVDGAGSFSLNKRLVIVDQAEANLNNSTLKFSGSLRPSLSRYLIDLDYELPQTPCDQLIGSVPREILAPYDGFDWSGSVQGTGKIYVNAENLDATDFGLTLDNDCKFVDEPFEAQLNQYRRSFTHIVPAADGGQFTFTTGPNSVSWTDIEQISPYLIHAVLAHEDAGFFKHSGFAIYAIEDALEKNLERGRFAFGASTISMQLAKNLFLSRDKKLARKFREIILTWWLESQLTKTEILELYLNIIEYGPNIYGIRNASNIYFKCEPHELTLAQATYLATSLPSPVRYYNNNFAVGELSRRKRGEMEFLINHMERRDRITPEASAAALAELDNFVWDSLKQPWQPGDTAVLPIETRNDTATASLAHAGLK